MMDLGIAGKTALVTGGDSGIGWHTAQQLLDANYRVDSEVVARI